MRVTAHADHAVGRARHVAPVDLHPAPGPQDWAAPSPQTARRLPGQRARPDVDGSRSQQPFPAMIFIFLMDLFAGACSFLVVRDERALDVSLLLGLGLLLLGTSRLSRNRLTMSAMDDLPIVLGRLAAAAGATVVVLLVVGQDVTRQDLLRLVVAAALWGIGGLPLRAAAYETVRRVRGWTRDRTTLIVGTGLIARRIATILEEHPEYGLRPLGFLDDQPMGDLPVLGSIGDIARVVQEHRVSNVIVAFTSLPESRLVSLIRSCDRVDCEVYVVPRLFELHHRAVDTEFLWGIPLSRIRRPAFRSATTWLKRPLDIILTGLALFVVWPVMAVCALLARIETGNVLFRQERVGLDRRPFTVLKFQTLVPHEPGSADTTWNVAEDPGMGPVGRFLRRTSLDELPQLWNVMRGDMSLVGPRPERPHFAAEFGARFPQYDARSRVSVGLTGWAQIHHLRGDTSVDDRAFFDNYYIEHWSLWNDIKIMVRTVPSVFRAMGG